MPPPLAVRSSLPLFSSLLLLLAACSSSKITGSVPGPQATPTLPPGETPSVAITPLVQDGLVSQSPLLTATATPSPTSSPSLATATIAPAPTASSAGTPPPPPASATTVAPAATATAVPSATATAAAGAQPSPTSAPGAAASTQAGLSYSSPTIQSGGIDIIYLSLPASSATLSFGGLQYPMLNDNGRWWAIVGIGAFATAGEAPLSVTYTPPGQATSQTVFGSLTVVKRSYPVEDITLDATTSQLLAPDIVQNELNQRAAIYSGYTTQKLWSGPFRTPAAGPLSDTYGIARSYNGGPVTDYHRGTDFANNTGTPIYAAAAGRVVFAGELKVRGNSVIVDHGAGVFTAYHHLSRIDVTQGQALAAGQQVGLMGATGLVTGPHLHWEVIVRGIEVDGLDWLQGTAIGP